jgi:hypothetical protein
MAPPLLSPQRLAGFGMVSVEVKRFVLALGLGMVPFLVASVSARACSVPVFRHALQGWEAEPYQVFLFHRGPLTGKDRRVLEHLERFTGARQRPILTVNSINLNNATDTPLLKIFKQQKDVKLPWIMTFYPGDRRLKEPVWKGHLTMDVVDRLVSSPVRETIATRILQGESAVAVLLESGNNKQDARAANIIEKALKTLANKFRLPDRGNPIPPSLLWMDEKYGPVKIDFSMIRVSRRDAREQMLVQMLQHSEDDLPTDQPMVFFIYGRGRVLLPLVGAGITPRNIEEATGLICGPCLCVVKRSNPDFEVLFNVAWAEGRPIEPEEKRAVLHLIGQLASESFAEREKATQQLERKGPRIGQLLRAHGLTSTDPEVRNRCKRILARFADLSGR